MVGKWPRAIHVAKRELCVRRSRVRERRLYSLVLGLLPVSHFQLIYTASPDWPPPAPLHRGPGETGKAEASEALLLPSYHGPAIAEGILESFQRATMPFPTTLLW